MREPPPRRIFLLGAMACLGGVAGCHTNPARVVTPTSAGGQLRLKLADQPELANLGGAIKLKPPGVDDTILLWRSSASEFSATSIKCTHRGCEVEVAEVGKSLACPCHGSEYNADGTVRHGPAPRALRHYAVEASPDGDLIVHLT